MCACLASWLLGRVMCISRLQMHTERILFLSIYWVSHSQSVGFAASVCVSSVVAVFQYTDAEWELVGHSRGVELQHSTE